MAQGSRFRRKELKQPDQFISTTDMVITYFSKHKTLITCIVIILILSVLLGFWLRYNQNTKSLRMESLYYKMEQIRADNLINSKEKINKLETLLNDFIEGPQKQRAILILANQLYDFHEYSRAISFYQDILINTSPMDLTHQLANMGLAHSLESKKDYKRAIGIFKTILESPNNFPLFQVYLSLARCYELNNDLNGALLTLREMNIRFSNHPNLDLVESRINKIKAIN